MTEGLTHFHPKAGTYTFDLFAHSVPWLKKLIWRPQSSLDSVHKNRFGYPKLLLVLIYLFSYSLKHFKTRLYLTSETEIRVSTDWCLDLTITPFSYYFTPYFCSAISLNSLFQVEYAIEAVKLGSTAVAIQTTQGVILAVEKRITSPLLGKFEFLMISSSSNAFLIIIPWCLFYSSVKSIPAFTNILIERFIHKLNQINYW